MRCCHLRGVLPAAGEYGFNNQYYPRSEGYFGLDAPRSTPFNRWIRVETLYDQTGDCEDSTILALPGVPNILKAVLGRGSLAICQANEGGVNASHLLATVRGGERSGSG